MCPFAVLPSSKHLLTCLQYTTHQPHQPAWPYPRAGAIGSPPSALFAQSFPTRGYGSAGVYSPSQHHRSHYDPYSHARHYSHTHSAYSADGRGHRHVQPVPMPVQVPTHSRSRRGDGPRVAMYTISPDINPKLDPSHSHSDPRYTHAKPILRNRGSLPHVVSHRICPS